VWQGFISSEDAAQFFEDYSKITFKNTLNELETLFGDAILVSSVSCSLFNEDLFGWVALDLSMLCRMAAERHNRHPNYRMDCSR